MVLTLGRVYWWFEAPWLGVLLAIGLACRHGCRRASSSTARTRSSTSAGSASREIVHFTGCPVDLSHRPVGADDAAPSASSRRSGLQNEQMKALSLGHPLRRPSPAGSPARVMMKPGPRARGPRRRACRFSSSAPSSTAGATNLTRPAEMYREPGPHRLRAARSFCRRPWPRG